MNRRQKIIVSVVGIFIVLLALVGITYGYFLTRIQGNTNTTSITVTTADLKLVYGDGNNIITGTNVEPGWTTNGLNGNPEAKTFTIKNEGNATVENFNIYLEDVVNTLTRKIDLIYTITCENTTEGATSTECEDFEVVENELNSEGELIFPSVMSIIAKDTLEPKTATTNAEEHTYKITVTYKEAGIDQSIDMGKVFRAKVNIYDAKFEEIGNFQLINVVNLYDHSSGYISKTGEIMDGSSTGSYLRVPVKSGEQWVIKHEQDIYYQSAYGVVRLEDSSKEMVSSVTLTLTPKAQTIVDSDIKSLPNYDTLVYAGHLIEIPSGISYMSVPLSLQSPYQSFDNTNTIKIVKVKEVDEETEEEVVIKWSAIGDSITEKNYTASVNYVDLVSESLNLTTTNLGDSGYGYGCPTRSDKSYIQYLSSIPTDTDIITFFGSFNDYNAGNYLGLASDVYIEGQDNTTAAYMKYCFDYVQTNYPDAKIAVISPAPWKLYNEGSEAGSKYVNTLKEICDSKGILFLDLFNGSELHPEDEENLNTYFYNADGIHPNDAGHELLAAKITPFIESIVKSN